ncbi:MAG TPA: NAD(P)/FAD-dependent oxidoreductase [Candidatus Nitrosocosmicus sp.]
MEKFDVAIIGGGSAGLAALKRLSSLGKQTILLEGGKEIGTKNVSGGILYSKSTKKGNVYNVEDVFDNFLDEAPIERKITKYVLHATSNDKLFSMDLTALHNYQTKFGYSVLLNKLLKWFAKDAMQSAETLGGGIISGIHVKMLSWIDENTIIIETDELEPFQVKAVIAADGVNSEIAEITGARSKFAPSELYQGVKVVVKLPEDLIEERFELSKNEGSAHLFVGDITLNHVGGGFLYTNKDTISIGAVYHYDSLIENPSEPNLMINALLSNAFVMELIKEDVPTYREHYYKTLSKEEELRSRYKSAKLIKNWKELHQIYYSSSNVANMLDKGYYKSKDEIKNKLDLIRDDLVTKYGIDFEKNYVELEFSTKLVPDGKRCRMKKPYYKNVLFVGDAAGRGVFLGPRIEGINVGIDDAVRAAECISESLDQNNIESMGKRYGAMIEESSYTHDMTEIDKNYLNAFLDCTKDIPKNIIGAKYGSVFRLISNTTFRNMTIGFANKLGYKRILPLLDSTHTYNDIPIDIAKKAGKSVNKTYTIHLPSIEERVAKLKYNDDSLSHIKILNPHSDFMKRMTILCPTKCYSVENDRVILQHEGCIECGTCAKETKWMHPRGEKGIIYQYG